MSHGLRWHLPHGVTCCFSTAADGDLRDPLARGTWLRRVRGSERHAVVRQVHGAGIVTAVPTAPLPDADGMVTSEVEVALIAFGADCPGLCIAAPDVLGIAHCGWRGTAAGIVGNLVAAVARRSRHPIACFGALIGPGIAADDYEVDAPVLDARPWPPASVRPGRDGHAWLDLTAAIHGDLSHCGISDIVTATERTSRDPRLWSYRRDGRGLVQGLAAWRENPSCRPT